MNKLLVLLLVLLVGCSTPEETPEPASHMNVFGEERAPEFFEPFLIENPNDGDHRVAALVWYSRRERTPAKLKEHTFQLIEHHPSNMHIFFENYWLFLSDHTYRSEVISKIESKTTQNTQSAGAYWVLAEICKTGAMPVYDGTPEGKERILKYYGISSDASLVTTVNSDLFKKAELNFSKAIDLAEQEKDAFYLGLYAQQYAKFMGSAEHYEDAISICNDALKRMKKVRGKRGEKSSVVNQEQDLRDQIEALKKTQQDNSGKPD